MEPHYDKSFRIPVAENGVSNAQKSALCLIDTISASEIKKASYYNMCSLDLI